MRIPLPFFTILVMPLVTLFAADVVPSSSSELPKTLMTIRDKQLATENFDKPLAPFTGKPFGFASGFSGWRYNAGPSTGKSGQWQLADGVFTGIESPEAHHPATASFGIQFKDAIIQCDFRLNDAPANGQLYRSIFVKATDVKDYVCALLSARLDSTRWPTTTPASTPKQSSAKSSPPCM